MILTWRITTLFHKENSSETGVLWSHSLVNKDRTIMQGQFKKAGYYTLLIKDDIRLIVLNSILFSQKARGNEKEIERAAAAELAWLHQQLVKAQAQQQQVLIAMHIPPSVDIHTSLQQTALTIATFWKEKYLQGFQQELRSFAPIIMAVLPAHIHYDWSQLLPVDNKNKILMIGTPSVSPIYGNKPGFKIFSYHTSSLQFENAITYDLSVASTETRSSNTKQRP